MSTLAEQVVEQLKTDMDNVYDAGYQKGKSEGGGKDYLQYAMQPTFAPSFFDDVGEESLTFTFLYTTSLFRLFMNVQNNTVKHITINANQTITNIGQLLYGALDNTLERLTINFDTSKVTNFGHLANNRRALKVIDGLPLDFSSATGALTTVFGTLFALEEIRFVPNTIHANFDLQQSPLLSAESIQSIIDGLADLTGKDSCTLILHADVKAKLTEEQIATITSKNWTLA